MSEDTAAALLMAIEDLTSKIAYLAYLMEESQR